MTIRIHHLNIRLKGISSKKALKMLNRIGPELIHQLGQKETFMNSTNPTYIPEIDGGTVQTKGDMNSSRVNQTIAANIVGVISNSIDSKSQGKT
jgi:hypothetical protein